MEPSQAESSKPLPAAIPELQRILLEAKELNRTTLERIRSVFANASERQSSGIPPAPEPPATSATRTEADLARIVAEKIAHSGVAFVFGAELASVWPVAHESDARWRPAKIYEFAGRYGWEGYVMNEGHMAMFRPVRATEEDTSSRGLRPAGD